MVRHRILLINPPRINGSAWTREGRCQEKEDVLGTVKPPITLALLGAILRNNASDFKLLDANILGLDCHGICRWLSENQFHPDIIIYGTTTPTIVADTKTLAFVKERFNSKLIAFGAHITGIPGKTLEALPEIDIGIIGEPELVILDMIKKSDFRELEKINNVVYRNTAGEIVVNRRLQPRNGLDSLPTPAWDLLPLEKYTLPFTGQKYLLVETSRGCPFSCDFCVAPLYHGTVFRQKSPLCVVDEIETLQRKFDINAFYLWGDTVTLSKKFMNDFCDEIIQRKLDIKWFSNSRADTISDLELVKKMKASGCWMLSIGIESLNEKTLDSIQKKLSVEKIIHALKLLHEVGIASFGFFILGHPDETREDIAKTVRLALRLPLDYANFYPAVPYPGTQFYEKCVKNNYLPDSASWEKMDYSNYVLKTDEFDETSVMKEISRAKRKFYLRMRFIINHIRLVGVFNTFMVAVKCLFNFIAQRIVTKLSTSHKNGKSG